MNRTHILSGIVSALILLIGIFWFRGCSSSTEAYSTTTFRPIAEVWGGLLVDQAVESSAGPGDVLVLFPSAGDEEEMILEWLNPFRAAMDKRVAEHPGYRLRYQSVGPEGDNFVQLPPFEQASLQDVRRALSEGPRPVAILSFAGRIPWSLREEGVPVVLHTPFPDQAKEWVEAGWVDAAVVRHPRDPKEPLRKDTRDLYFQHLSR